MLLIMGNGFDINLGLNTRYSDFMNSIKKSEQRKITPTHLSYLIFRPCWFSLPCSSMLIPLHQYQKI
jgi:hypothetical protein